MKYLLLLFLISLIACAKDYYECLDELAKPLSKEVVSNIRNHSISSNLPIIYIIFVQQCHCAFSSLISLNQVRDYIYKDIYEYIFKDQSDEELSLILKYFWDWRNDKEVIKECLSMLGNTFECEELINSFNDWINRKLDVD